MNDSQNFKKGTEAKSKSGTGLARWQRRAGGGDLVAVRPAAARPPDERPCVPLVHFDLGGRLVRSWRMAFVRQRTVVSCHAA
jgi:hypothetical protein